MIRRTILGRNKLSSIHVHNIDLCLILGKARLFEANKHFLSNWLASECLVKKGKEQAWLSELFHRTQEKYSIRNILFSYFNMKDSVWTKLTIPFLRSMEATVRYSMCTYLRDVHNICCFLSLGWHNPVCNWPRARRIVIRGLLWTREYFHHEYFSDMLSLSKGLLSQFIKKNLSENSARSQRFYLSYHVLPCHAGGEVIRLLPDDRYLKSDDFHTPRAKLNEILKVMLKTVAVMPSTLSSKLGVTIFNLFTKEQFQLVH